MLKVTELGSVSSSSEGTQTVLAGNCLQKKYTLADVKAIDTAGTEIRQTNTENQGL